MKHIGRYVCILSLLSFWIPFAAAQNTASINIGFGTFHVKSNGSGIDNLNSLNAGGSCTPGTGDIYCQANPALSNFFLGFGGDVMLSKQSWYRRGDKFYAFQGKLWSAPFSRNLL